MVFLRKLSAKWLLVIVALSTIGGAGAVTLYVNHTIPIVPVYKPTAPVVSSTCVSLTGPGGVAEGTSGIALFNCSGQPALTVGAVGSATPVFTLPSAYNSLSIAQFPGTTYCFGTGTNVPIPLTSGQPVSFSRVDIPYDYCASYTNAQSPNLPSFQVTWNSS